ncbi:Mov34/MPN/PAD-1 family protein [Citromicrobium bathyomarinum]|uniref:Mov34/MPN/PAD-1 family protein n=1 Tax=Citromicrobium bathyomarinum TaxID=72174 RepID=UPI00315AF2FF
MAFFVYILRCADGSYYTGHTDNLEIRIAEHQAGEGSHWTRTRLPVEHVWSQDFVSREEALASERRIKGWSRGKKEALMAGRWDRLTSLAKARTIRPSTGSGRTASLTEAEPRAAIRIDQTIIQAVFAHAANAHPHECCGLLLGEGSAITHAHPTANIHPRPETHFEIDPAALIAAHKSEREGGPRILGYYHSHPKGRAEPSLTDRESAAHDGKVWAIVANGGIGFFRDGEDGFEALSYEVAPR